MTTTVCIRDTCRSVPRLAAWRRRIQIFRIFQSAPDLGRAIRAAFIAEKGFVLAALDYSQMELRIAAFMSGDEKMIGIFKRGGCPSSSESRGSVQSGARKSRLRNAPPSKDHPTSASSTAWVCWRSKQNLGTSRDEAQKVLQRLFPGILDTLLTISMRSRLSRLCGSYTETFFGRRRYFEEYSVQDSIHQGTGRTLYGYQCAYSEPQRPM